MIHRLIDLFQEHKAVRDFALTGSVIVLGGLAFAHLLATTLQKVPAEVAAFSVQVAPGQAAQGQGSSRSRQVIRSVLDDDLLTGSTSRQTIVLDPCTGEQKAR